jgi:putative transposase
MGSGAAKRLRRRRPRPGDAWHLDEVFIRINGEQHYLWRAVDQHGVVLDILVQGRRGAMAAKPFFRRLLHGLKYRPQRIVTDGLRSYGVAQREVLPRVRHRTSRYLNNRAESAEPTTGVADAALQITRASPAFPFISQEGRNDPAAPGDHDTDRRTKTSRFRLGKYLSAVSLPFATG